MSTAREAAEFVQRIGPFLPELVTGAPVTIATGALEALGEQLLDKAKAVVALVLGRRSRAEAGVDGLGVDARRFEAALAELAEQHADIAAALRAAHNEMAVGHQTNVARDDSQMSVINVHGDLTITGSLFDNRSR